MGSRFRSRALVLSFCSLSLVACSSNSATSEADAATGALDASSVSNASSTFNALEGLLDSIDSSSASSRLSTRSQQQGPQAGDKSMLGCHYDQDRARTFRQMKNIQSPLCHMSIVEAGDPNFKIPQGEYGYFRLMGFKGGDKGSAEESQDALLRVGIFVDADGKKSLKFQMCEGGVQQEDFRISETEGGISAYTAHLWNHTDDKGNEMSGEGSFSVEAYGETSDALTKAIITAAFDDTFGEGSIHVEADRESARSSMLGYFTGSSGDFSHQSAVCVFSSKGEGSGKVMSTASFPPFVDPMNTSIGFCPAEDPMQPPTQVDPATTLVCPARTFTNTESFETVAGDPPQFLIDGAPNADLLALVDGCEMPTAAESPGGFVETWEGCAGDFTDIDLSKFVVEFEECRKFEDHEEDFKRCEEDSFKDQQN